MKTLLRFKRLREERKRIPFHSKLDLLTVNEHGVIIGVSGRMGIGLALEGVDYLLNGDESITSFFGELKKLFNHMPEGMVLSVMKRSSNDLLGYHKVVEESIQSDEPVACEIRKSKQWALKSQRVVKKELF